MSKSFWKEINPNFYIIGLHSEIDNNELKLDILETLEFPTLIKYIDSRQRTILLSHFLCSPRSFIMG